MDICHAIELLELHNKWRRGEENSEMVNPNYLGVAIDTIIKHHKKKNK